MKNSTANHNDDAMFYVVFLLSSYCIRGLVKSIDSWAHSSFLSLKWYCRACASGYE